ncbi:Snf7 family [Phakopsora pachyrhizi]|uniref:Snf7 family n=1 Tax=Phakopsora pachyrhizi TaxID=170000 RepID=A0AAV0AP35_PHAPC|nr:Snf7 family [Phakopsora pachyrhizi]
MNRIFGSSTSKKVVKPNLNDAIQSTESRIENIEVKVRKLDAELIRYKDSMKKLRDGPGKAAMQQRAMRVLKQKKLYESQLEQLQQQTFNMEQAIMTTENLRNTMATVDAMKQANKEMTKQYSKIDIGKIESITYDMEDLIDQANEVQESLGRSYGVPDEIDEDELQAELEALGDDLGELENQEVTDGIPSYLKEADSTKLPDLPDAESKDKVELIKAT